MGEMVTLADVVKDIGVPALFFLVAIYLAFKLIPDIVKSRQEAAKEQQAYYAKRQEQYDSQMQVLIRVAEQGNQAITQSSAAIVHSTEALRLNTEMHAKAADALARNTEELKALRADINTHDNRAEKIQVDVARVLERGDNR